MICFITSLLSCAMLTVPSLGKEGGSGTDHNRVARVTLQQNFDSDWSKAWESYQITLQSATVIPAMTK